MNILPSIIAHKDLVGRDRLYNVVSCLGKSCPWTQSITSNQMLGYLESEVHELHEEISILKSSVVIGDPAAGSIVSKDAMVSELGDILFDVLMLEMMMRR